MGQGETFVALSADWCTKFDVKGHDYLFTGAERLLCVLKVSTETKEQISHSLSILVEAIASEVSLAVGWAAHPTPAMTPRKLRYFKDLEESGESYNASVQWCKYIDRMIEILAQLLQTCVSIHGIRVPPFASSTTERLCRPLYQITGSAFRGPMFDVRFLINKRSLCLLLYQYGFFVSETERAGFSSDHGPAESSVFCIEDDDLFTLLLKGAAKADDDFSLKLLTYYSRDDESWVRELASDLIRGMIGNQDASSV